MKLTAMSAVLGFLGVALGAFGAHGLEGRLTSEGLAWWETATFYLLVHASLAAAISLHGKRFRWPVMLWIGSAAVFAGTLYLMALGAPRWLGAITPLGGLGLLAGWLGLALSSLRSEA